MRDRFSLRICFGPEDHKGFDNVYATVVEGGHPVLLDDWALLKH